MFPGKEEDQGGRVARPAYVLLCPSYSSGTTGYHHPGPGFFSWFWTFRNSTSPEWLCRATYPFSGLSSRIRLLPEPASESVPEGSKHDSEGRSTFCFLPQPSGSCLLSEQTPRSCESAKWGPEQQVGLTQQPARPIQLACFHPEGIAGRLFRGMSFPGQDSWQLGTSADRAGIRSIARHHG